MAEGATGKLANLTTLVEVYGHWHSRRHRQVGQKASAEHLPILVPVESRFSEG